MIRAIILCCDEQNRRMSLKDVPAPAPVSGVDAGINTNLVGAGVGVSHEPSIGRSYGDALNCGYMQERFSYSSGQSPSYTNYRMGWSTGYADCQANPRYHEGIISTPMPIKWRSRSASTGGGSREACIYDTEEMLEQDHPFIEMEDNISDESLSKWPPSGEQKNSLRKGFYTSFNKDIFQEKSDHERGGEDLWSSLEYPPSPKDAFRETCEFYGDPIFSRRKYPKYEMNGGLVNGGIAKMYRAKPKKLDFYKSDSKLSHLYNESSGEEMESLINPINRSKSLHDLQYSKTSSSIHSSHQVHQRQHKMKEEETQIGLSEHDLNRARSVLGLPLSSEPYSGPRSGYNLDGVKDQEKSELDLGYDSQPASNRNSINFSELLSGGKKEVARAGYHPSVSRERSHSRSRSQTGYSRRDHNHLHQNPGGGARVSFPSPCITGTRQLTDQSSTSHPSSPPSPSPAGPRSSSSSAITSEADPSLKMLKQYYLDCILKIDPNHPVGQSFPNDGATTRNRDRSRRSSGAAAVKNPEFKRMYSASRAENLRLRSEINNLRSDLEAANRHLDVAFQESAKNSGSDTEKREKKAMEKKLAHIREQIKGLTISGNLTCQVGNFSH